MLDEQDGDAELVAHAVDGVHQLLGLVGVHTGGGLVQQQQLRVRGQCAGNFQLALLAVGQLAGLVVGLLVQVKDFEQLHGLAVHLVLFFLVSRQTQDAGPHIVPDLVVQTDLDVIQHRHIIEQADILEGTCNTGLADKLGVLAGNVLAVQNDVALSGL